MTANTGHERSSVRANPVRVGARANRGVGGARRGTEVVQPSGGHASRVDFPRIAVGGEERFEVVAAEAERAPLAQTNRAQRTVGGSPPDRARMDAEQLSGLASVDKGRRVHPRSKYRLALAGVDRPIVDDLFRRAEAGYASRRARGCRSA